MSFSGMLRREVLLRTDVSEEPRASVIRVTRIGELGTMLAVNSNRRALRSNTNTKTKTKRITSHRASAARYGQRCSYVRFEVFTAVTMRNFVFWDVMPCFFCKNQCFGRI
jgi:hypothetical protein